MQNSTPYFRLSCFYLMYFAALGVFVPYWTVYLHTAKAFSPVQIGELMAIFMATKVVAPFAWGWLVDHTGQRLGIIRLTSLLAVIFFLGVYRDYGYAWMALVMAGFGFFWNASLPQFEALTLNHLGKQAGRYSRIRLWGSIGFILTVVSLPPLLERQGLGRIVDTMLLLFLGIWLSTWLVQDKPHVTQHLSSHSLHRVLRRPAVWILLLVCALQQASHGVYYTFFSIYLEHHGYTATFIGWMWALGVLAEVVLFLFMHRLIGQFGAAWLFVLSMFLTAVRWLMLGSGVDYVPVLVLAQLLHAATYGLFHASAIYLVHHQFPGRLQGRGQALYSGLSFGAGATAGSLLSGYGWEFLGATRTFQVAAIVVVIGWVLALVYVREEEHEADGVH